MEVRSYPALGALCLAIGLAQPGRAATVEFAFTGEVSGVTDDHAVLDGSVIAGTQVFGHVRYDTTLTDGSADPTLGIYGQSIPSGEFVVEVGNYTIAVPALTLLVYDGFVFGGPPIDSFDWRFEGSTVPLPGAPGASLNELVFRLDDAAALAFSSDALPAAPVDLADFTGTGFTIQGCLDTELSGFLCQPAATIVLSGPIESVPEAEAGAAALAALAALGSGRFARRRQAGLSL